MHTTKNPFYKQLRRMSKSGSKSYRLLRGAYSILPFRRHLSYMLRKAGVQKTFIYKFLKFKGKFEVDIAGNNKFYLYNNGGTIANETFWKGLFVSWEQDTGWIWKQMCRCSNSIFDIGANIGIYSLVAKKINPKAEIYAFEPSVNTYNQLVLNNSINDFDIRCEQIALSNKNGEQIFYDIPHPNQTTASLSPNKLKNRNKNNIKILEYTVKTLTLSSYIENNQIGDIDLIKMDIEMHEPEAIEGMGDYLQKFKPVVIIEILNDEIADRLNKIITIENHIIFHLSGNEQAERKEKFSVRSGKNWNYIFFHKDLRDKMKQHTTLPLE